MAHLAAAAWRHLARGSENRKRSLREQPLGAQGSGVRRCTRPPRITRYEAHAPYMLPRSSDHDRPIDCPTCRVTHASASSPCIAPTGVPRLRAGKSNRRARLVLRDLSGSAGGGGSQLHQGPGAVKRACHPRPAASGAREFSEEGQGASLESGSRGTVIVPVHTRWLLEPCG
jgi:hypothetical protein